MANFTLPLLLLISLLSLTSKANSAMAKRSNTPSQFIKSSCSVTLYPALCIQSLSSFASTIQKSPKQIAQAALTVSLSNAKSARAFVVQKSKSSKGKKGVEYAALRDCVENMGDSADRLSKSISELKQMGQAREESFMWHMSNVQTWVSAALTDATSCMDGFAGRVVDNKLKVAVRGRITQVARVTSNALALVNQFADKH